MVYALIVSLLVALKTYRPDECSTKRITDPSSRCTHIAVSCFVSIVTRQIFRTSAKDKMLAIEFSLNHTVPRFGKSPTMLESWCPPFVRARRTCSLGRMFVNMSRFLKTEMVDCESNRIQFRSSPALACASMYAYCTSVVPVAGSVSFRPFGHSVE